MQMVLLTALGVGGATVIGAAIGFIFKKASHRFNDIILAFATKQKFRTISLLVYLPAIAAMCYIVFAGYSIVTWSAGWVIVLLGVVADIIYIFSILMSNMKYFTYKQEVDE